MKKQSLFFYLSFFIFTAALGFFVHFQQKDPKDKYDTETLSNLITVITTTNPIVSIPSTKILYDSQSSLFRIPAFAKCKKIIVFDGVQPQFEQRKDDYEEYKKRVIELTKTDPFFTNTELVFCARWAHISGAVQEAIKRVKTPYLFVHQHDFILQKKFDLAGIIATMEVNPNVKHVRLAKYPTNTYAGQWEYDGPVLEKVIGPHFVPLCLSSGWSDNDHITRLDYYTDFVLPMCTHCAMEWALHPALKFSLLEHGLKGHIPFGTYIYGNIDDGGYILHSDGREIWNK